MCSSAALAFGKRGNEEHECLTASSELTALLVSCSASSSILCKAAKRSATPSASEGSMDSAFVHLLGDIFFAPNLLTAYKLFGLKSCVLVSALRCVGPPLLLACVLAQGLAFGTRAGKVPFFASRFFCLSFCLCSLLWARKGKLKTPTGSSACLECVGLEHLPELGFALLEFVPRLFSSQHS